MSDDTNTGAEGAETETGKTNVRQMSFSLLDDGNIRADFDGQEPLFLNPAQLPENITSAAVTEGVISRARGYTSKLAGDSRTPEALRAAVEKGFAALLAGVWKIERTAGEGSDYTIEQEAAHLFRQLRAKAKGEEYTGTLAEAAAQFATLTDEQKKQLKALPRYQQAYAEIKARVAAEKAAKLAKKADADEDDAPM